MYLVAAGFACAAMFSVSRIRIPIDRNRAGDGLVVIVETDEET